MPVYVELHELAVEDLKRYAKSGNLRLFIRKLLFIERNGEQAGRPLRSDLAGWHKLTVGDRNWRIVFTVDAKGGSAKVLVIGERDDAACYDEAIKRLRKSSAQEKNPSLADALAQLLESQRPRRKAGKYKRSG